MAATRSSEAARAACPLCHGEGGTLVWRDERLRVILANEPDYPCFTRVIWNGHIAEATELAVPERQRLMDVVWLVEAVQREVLAPDKVNHASFGNLVPHLHWHVVPRWRDDAHFPDPVWGRRAVGRDEAIAARASAQRAHLPAYLALLASRLG